MLAQDLNLSADGRTKFFLRLAFGRASSVFERWQEMPLAHEDLTERIIGAAIEVHRRLGPGFLESVYEKALIIELGKRGLGAASQVEVPLQYDGVQIGVHILDLLVEGTIVVELKAVKNLDDVHFAIVRSYLRAAGLEHGLILNFSRIPLEIKRVMVRKTESY